MNSSVLFIGKLYLRVIEKGKHIGLSFIQYVTAKEICISSDPLMETHLQRRMLVPINLTYNFTRCSFYFLIEKRQINIE